MPVHYGGQIGDVDGVRRLALKYNLKVVEDAAHCCPAYYRDHGTTGPQDDGTGGGESRKQKAESRSEPSSTDGRLSTLNSQLSTDWSPVGSSADISCFSFYANKTITTGEGGMACTDNDEYADRMRIMSLHGISKDAWKRFTAEGSWYYEIIAPGFKYNLTDIAAAIGIHQLRKANRFHRRRTEIVEAYRNALKDIEEVTLPASDARPDPFVASVRHPAQTRPAAD